MCQMESNVSDSYPKLQAFMCITIPCTVNKATVVTRISFIRNRYCTCRAIRKETYFDPNNHSYTYYLTINNAIIESATILQSVVVHKPE